MNAARHLRRFGEFWVGERSLCRFRLFEIFFSIAFLIYMSRNLLAADEWLTDSGFHPSVAAGRAGVTGPLPTLPGWMVPLFALAIIGSVAGAVLAPRWRRLWFAWLTVLAWYARGVDPASAFALNKIFVVGFFFIALSPGYDRASFRGSVAGMRAFQLFFVTLYFATGLPKAMGGDWLAHPDVVWSHAQGHYRTPLAAWMLRNLPLWGWAAIQYAVLTFELGAPLWLTWRRTRPYAMIFGLGFHLGIALMMKAVWVFSLQMAAFYVLFIPEDWAREWIRRVRVTRAVWLEPGPEGDK